MEIKYFSQSIWAEELAKIILNDIKFYLSVQDRCRVMLTGGRSSILLCQALSKLAAFRNIQSVDFYITDERNVPLEHSESNFKLIQEYLFNRNFPENSFLHGYPTGINDKEAVAISYEKILPKNIDILLLSVGEDGHIASLFPNNSSLHEETRLIVHTIGDKPPFERFTITPKVIKSSKKIYVMACGSDKKHILEKVNSGSYHYTEIPAMLVGHGIWISYL
ncbi:6-phosphogluconolactonase [Leptospira levettii]|uniref:6-phosphogluconolactonase n=1 Tax=Leptospira levettii TaxID=2023178 RepID=UPI00223D03CA|nr:6-phosphogluconolactonase [Leptospira levettii]MCW7497026.1 6-phosphogluconolactonase [Leptospira levettii]